MRRGPAIRGKGGPATPAAGGRPSRNRADPAAANGAACRRNPLCPSEQQQAAHDLRATLLARTSATLGRDQPQGESGWSRVVTFNRLCDLRNVLPPRRARIDRAANVRSGGVSERTPANDQSKRPDPAPPGRLVACSQARGRDRGGPEVAPRLLVSEGQSGRAKRLAASAKCPSA